MNLIASCFGPILGWELAVLARRSRYFLVRVAFGLVVFFVLWSSYTTATIGGQTESIQSLSRFAASFFSSFALVQLIAALLLTPAYVATAIAVEKQRRTIEYLFATDLRNREIVLGKWLARTLNAFMLLLVGTPILFLASLLGGIDLDRVIILLLMTAGCTASTAALSIWISVHSNEVRRALANCYSALALLLIAPILYFAVVVLADFLGRQYLGIHGIETGCNRWLEATGVKTAVECGHPIFFYSSIMNAGMRPQDSSSLLLRTVTMAAMHFAAAAAFLTLAVLQLRSAWLRSVGGRPGKTSAAKASPADVAVKSTDFRDQPMFWKEWRFGEQRKSGCAGRILMALALLGFYYPIGHAIYERLFLNVSSMTPETLNFFIRAMACVLLALAYGKVAIRSASSIGVERDRDCWVSLLGTPLTAKEIVQGKFFGSLKPMVQVFLAMAPMWLACVAFDALSPLALPCMLIVFSVFACFIAAFGIRQSVARATTGKAIGVTLTTCILLSGLAHSFLSVLLLPMLFFGVRDQWIVTMYYSSIPWFAIVMSMFRTADLRWLDSQTVGPAIPISAFWILVYGVVAAVLYRSAISRFPAITGRTEDGGWSTGISARPQHSDNPLEPPPALES